jgi:hypothetical protein
MNTNETKKLFTSLIRDYQMASTKPQLILELIKCNYQSLPKAEIEDMDYIVIRAAPATGLLYITNNSPYFLTGQVRLRGRNNGRYPFKYLEMLDRIFGHEENTIEVCSHDSKFQDAVTVDINPAHNPDIVDDAQTLNKIENNRFNRWRCDPPYSSNTAHNMYNTELPTTSKLLQAGARVCKKNSFLFLLLGPQNYQWTPKGVRRIGCVLITIVPNNEFRVLNIFHKFSD